jgi:hypothetical protein
LAAALIVMLGTNALVVGAETKPAHADIGRSIDLPRGDDPRRRPIGARGRSPLGPGDRAAARLR